MLLRCVVLGVDLAVDVGGPRPLGHLWAGGPELCKKERRAGCKKQASEPHSSTPPWFLLLPLLEFLPGISPNDCDVEM